MPSQPLIYWFRNDLRLHDNPTLQAALATRHPIIPVFIIDPLWSENDSGLGFPRMGELREQFLMQSLASLKDSLKKRGNTLYTLKGETMPILSRLYRESNAAMLMAQREYAWEEIKTEEALSARMNTRFTWGSLLFQPDEVDFPVETSPFYYTKFKNKVLEHKPVPPPLDVPAQITAPEKVSFFDDIKEIKRVKTPKPNASDSFFTGGEEAALNRFARYMHDKAALHYAETRNQFEGKNFSSRLGAWLANGSLSPRTFYHALKNLQQSHPDKADSVQTIIEQLIWRDYFRFLFLRYGRKLFTIKGLRTSEPTMYNDYEAFEQWRKGETGQPIVDALMHELAETGFMSNRGRMLVSFYLAKVMKVNWQWGGLWFENRLLDYDVCSNYGNWAYQSGRGTDSRVNRRFNLEKQAAKFDPDGAFVKKWGKGEAEGTEA